jgi:hypothetical protein
MSEATPESHVEIAFSDTVSADARAAILADLAARAIKPTVTRLEYRSIDVPPVVIALTVVITYVIKPTAEAVGVQIRDSLTLACVSLRGRLGLGGTYIVTIEAGERRVAYWVPADQQEGEAWVAMFEDFDRRPDVGLTRRWWPGKGWMTDPEIWEEDRRPKPEDD